MTKTLVGLFDEPSEARDAAQELLRGGLRHEDIGVMTGHGAPPIAVGPTNAGNDATMMHDPTDDVGAGVLSGASVGAVLGGVGGLLVGLAVLPLPGIGPVLAAGPILSALAGLGIGAATGGLVTALTGVGVPEEHAPHYAEAVRRGGTVVTVHVDDALAPQVWGIMTRHHAVDVNQRAVLWRRDGWSGYDPSAPAYTADEAARERRQYRSLDGDASSVTHAVTWPDGTSTTSSNPLRTR